MCGSASPVIDLSSYHMFPAFNMLLKVVCDGPRGVMDNTVICNVRGLTSCLADLTCKYQASTSTSQEVGKEV